MEGVADLEDRVAEEVDKEVEEVEVTHLPITVCFICHTFKTQV